MNEPQLTVLIVSYNSAAVLAPCLQSLQEAVVHCPCRVLVVDNASDDDSLQQVREAFPQVDVLALPDNRGFAGANNAGLQQVQTPYVLMLNPDTLVTGESLERLLAYAQTHEECGVLAPRVVDERGTVQRSCFRDPRLWHFLLFALRVHRWPGYVRLFGFAGEYAPRTYEREHDVEVLQGCCLLMPTGLARKLGGFDERYFMYYEDADLCRRVRAAGYAVRYLPSPSIVHLGAASSGQDNVTARLRQERSARLYFLVYHSRASLLALHALRTGEAWLHWCTVRLRRLARGREVDAHYADALLRWHLGHGWRETWQLTRSRKVKEER